MQVQMKEFSSRREAMGWLHGQGFKQRDGEATWRSERLKAEAHGPGMKGRKYVVQVLWGVEEENTMSRLDWLLNELRNCPYGRETPRGKGVRDGKGPHGSGRGLGTGGPGRGTGRGTPRRGPGRGAPRFGLGMGAPRRGLGMGEGIRMGKKTPYATMDSKTRRRANAALNKAGFDGNGRFRTPGYGLTIAMNVLSKFGIEQDEVVSAHKIDNRSQKGHTQVRLAKTNIADSFSPVSIKNSLLVYSWHEMQGGKYEVVAYLS